MIENLTCPKCNGRMQPRTNRGTGQKFWGCVSYPACNGTRNTDGEVNTRQNSQRRDMDDERGAPSDRARNNDRRRWENE